jgi:hypothetical protein
MRKIESLMNAAISQEIDWRKDNTKVVNVDGVSEVYLHNNLIARVGDTWLQLFDGGWRSNTTKSRLNAILREHGNGESVYQQNHVWKFRNLDGSVIPFDSGIYLD